MSRKLQRTKHNQKKKKEGKTELKRSSLPVPGTGKKKGKQKSKFNQGRNLKHNKKR